MPLISPHCVPFECSELLHGMLRPYPFIERHKYLFQLMLMLTCVVWLCLLGLAVEANHQGAWEGPGLAHNIAH